MIVTQFISGEADLAADRYGAMIDSFRGMYARSLDQSHFGTPRQIAALVTEAYAIAGAYLDAEAEFIASSIETVALEAQRVTLDELSAASSETLSEAVSDHADESSAYLSRELAIQIERDIAQLQHALRKMILQVGMSARAQQIPPRTALMQYRLAPINDLAFVFHDRGANKWPSRRFVRAVWRQRLLATYNETVLLTLADHGVNDAEVSHTDSKAPVNGLEVSIIAGSELPTYAEIQSTVFHPNSEAILRKIAA